MVGPRGRLCGSRQDPVPQVKFDFGDWMDTRETPLVLARKHHHARLVQRLVKAWRPAGRDVGLRAPPVSPPVVSLAIPHRRTQNSSRRWPYSRCRKRKGADQGPRMSVMVIARQRSCVLSSRSVLPIRLSGTLYIKERKKKRSNFTAAPSSEASKNHQSTGASEP
jgi:hypothetical protein